ncbi:MAG TPA: hypothetical protein VFS00_04860 [Polyangiaceae bacterium]|nr:hypothetical protein [Polyangiaceae bacterium]
MARSFRLVDVFTNVPYSGNPLAVALEGEGLEVDAMHPSAEPL